MTSTNDTEGLSRSNPKSNEKAVSSDLGPGLLTKIANPPSPNRIYHNVEEGIAYDTVEEISQWLVQRPRLVQGHQERMLAEAVALSRLGNFRGMRETLNFLVDVRIRVAELRGDRHLS